MVFNLSETNSGGGGGGTTVTITCDDPDAYYYTSHIEDGAAYIDETPFPAECAVGGALAFSTTMDNVEVLDDDFAHFGEVIHISGTKYVMGIPDVNCKITGEL